MCDNAITAATVGASTEPHQGVQKEHQPAAVGQSTARLTVQRHGRVLH
jgi:hypothetical protein